MTDQFRTLTNSMLDLTDTRCETFFAMLRNLARLKEQPTEQDVDKVWRHVYGERKHLQ